MTMHETLLTRDDIDWQYVSSKEGRRGLTSIEDCVDSSMKELVDNIKDKARLIKATNNGNWHHKYREKKNRK